MSSENRAHSSMASSLRWSPGYVNEIDEELAHRRPAVRKSKGPAPKRKGPQSPVSESYKFTELPASEQHKYTNPELSSYLSHLCDFIAQKVRAGLQAVETAIAENIKPYEDEMISVYKSIAEGVSRFAQSFYFSRAEVAHTHKAWEANRLYLGLPQDGDTDDLTPKDPEGKQQQETNVIPESDPTAKRNPSTDTSAEDQANASSTDGLSDPNPDPASPEKNASESAFILDSIVTRRSSFKWLVQKQHIS